MFLLFLFSSLQSPAMYQVQMPHMTVSQSKPYRPGKGEKSPFNLISHSGSEIRKREEMLPFQCLSVCSPGWSCVSSSQHAPAEVRPASPSRHTHHDAPSDRSRTADRSTQPHLLHPVLHLQPAAVRQSAAGPADDALPVTSRIPCHAPVAVFFLHA